MTAAWSMVQTTHPEGLKIPNNFVVSVVPHGQNIVPAVNSNPQTPQFQEFLATFWPIVESTASTLLSVPQPQYSATLAAKNDEEIPLDDDLMTPDNNNNNNNQASNITTTNDEEIALDLDDGATEDPTAKKVKLDVDQSVQVE